MNNKYKIYCITNRINNKKYIGVTKNDLKERVSKGYYNNYEFKNGNISIRRKKVICIENNEIYDSVSEAQKLTNSFHIGDVCNGKRKKSNNLTWRWYCES